MTIRTVAINARDDIDAVNPTSAGATATDVTVIYDDEKTTGEVLTALESAKVLVQRDIE